MNRSNTRASKKHGAFPMLLEPLRRKLIDASDAKDRFASSNASEWTKEEEKRIVRKIDYRILPLLAICFTGQLLVKNALGSASILGIIEDLRLEDNQFSWAHSIFFFGYMFFTYPTSILMVKFPVGKYVSITVIAWAAIAMLHAACYNFGGLMAVRAFLGVAEATSTPAFAILVGLFYTRSEQPSRQNLWFLGQVLGGVSDSIITWGITHLSGALPTWKYPFLIYGPVTVAWGVLMLMLLPDHPSTATFLSAREREIATSRVSTNAGENTGEYKNTEVTEALIDPQVWLLTIYTLAVQMGNGGFGTFGLLVLVGVGFDNRTTILLQAPLAGFQLVFILMGTLGSSFKNCRLFTMMLLMMLTVIGITMTFAIHEDHPWARYGGFCLTTAYAANLPMTLSLVTSNICGHTKRSTALFMIFVANCVGNIVGPQFFVQSEHPNYRTGMISCIVNFAAGLFFLVTLRVYYMWQNRTRGTADQRDPDNLDQNLKDERGQQTMGTNDETTDLNNKNFVYAL